jgi:hypothetical protein
LTGWSKKKKGGIKLDFFFLRQVEMGDFFLRQVGMDDLNARLLVKLDLVAI